MLKRNVIIVSIILITVSVIFLILIVTGNCCFKDRCQIPIQSFGDTPIFFNSKYDKFVYPEDDSIVIERDKSISIACPGSRLNVGPIWADMTCITETSFVLFDDNVDVTELYCEGQIKNTARYTGRSCENAGTEIEIGFDLGDEKFLKQMKICFDKKEQTTLYTEHVLTSFINNREQSSKRPFFEEGNFFNLSGQKLGDLYSRKLQRPNINKQLGIPENSTQVIRNGSSPYFISRGHLAPKADFLYASQQNASFYYVNAAPQWEIINAGSWNKLEWKIRAYVTKRASDLHIVTGSFDKLVLTKYSTSSVYIYYNPPSVAVPIPKVFWKVVYDPIIKKGVAFVGTNNPFLKTGNLDYICKDVLKSIKWISLNNKNLSSGFIYACDVDELRRVVKTVPELELKGLLIE